jgi:hypothetical protein
VFSGHLARSGEMQLSHLSSLSYIVVSVQSSHRTEISLSLPPQTSTMRVLQFLFVGFYVVLAMAQSNGHKDISCLSPTLVTLPYQR